MKDLVTKKRMVSQELDDELYHYRAIATRFLVQMKKDSGAFTIPCIIGVFNFTNGLCDLGAKTNPIPLAVFKQLGLGALTVITMQLLMADRMVKKLVGIIYDVLVRVENFIFPSNFVILDCKVYLDISFILGRIFLATGRTLVDMELGQLKFILKMMRPSSMFAKP